MTDLIDTTITRAEAELLILLRGAAERRFTLSVSHLGDVWMVKLADVDSAEVHEAIGLSFDKAWTATRHGPRADVNTQGED